MTFTPADFTALPEFGVGHATDLAGMTGCTCFVARGDSAGGVVCGVDVRGGAPATRETDLLRPENMVQAVNAVMIGGGSAFGLEASCGAMEVLSGRGMGFVLGDACVPIVPAACLFDLLLGDIAWPDKAMGASACEAALAFDAECDGGGPEQGIVGSGTGATVGKTELPEQAMKSGFGWSGAQFGDVSVISCVAVNALGNIVAEDGTWLAGVRGCDGKIIDPVDAACAAMAAGMGDNAGNNLGGEDGPCKNTTLGVVLTNARLTKAQATKVAQQAQDGYARAIKPVHTLNDGDTVFVMASGRSDAAPDLIGMMAADTMEAAIRSAARHSLSS